MQFPSKIVLGSTYAPMPIPKKVKRKIITKIWKTHIMNPLDLFIPMIPTTEAKIMMRSDAKRIPSNVYLLKRSYEFIKA